MSKVKNDPRVIRTRKLIMNSMIEISKKKDFKDIKIKDITAEATVNRATFYYHFMDKYDLKEKLLKEDLMHYVFKGIDEEDQLNEAMIIKIFTAMTKYQEVLETKCKRNSRELASQIEDMMKKELQDFFYQKLSKQSYGSNTDSKKITSILLSWGMYGAMLDWKSNSTLEAEDYINKALPNFKVHLNK